jgi:hypothetical protein
MKLIKNLAILIVFTIFTQGINAQPWMESIKSENPTFYEIQKSFMIIGKENQLRKDKGISCLNVGSGFGKQGFWLMVIFQSPPLFGMNTIAT